MDIGTWDVEDDNTSYHLNDPSNYVYGELGFERNPNGAVPLVNGGAHAIIVNRGQATGNVTAPSVPATTVALQNPFWRDAAVTITGGTVTVITVDGVATGLTAGTVIVPNGKSITLTYSSAPTWVWTIL